MQVIYHPESDALFTAPEFTQFDADQGCGQVRPSDLPAGAVIATAYGHSTVLPDLDFETYSEAGMVFLEGEGRSGLGKWAKVKGAPAGATNPLAIVGAPAYAEHESTEILSMAYNFKDGKSKRLWVPGMAPPQELFDYFAGGGLMEAHNSGFEWLIWNYNAVKKLGWPELPHKQLRCSMAKCKAFSIKAGLGDAGTILGIAGDDAKIKDGKRLLKKFSGPRTPTLADDRRRIHLTEDIADGAKLYEYNLGDLDAESAVSACVPDLSPDELELWLLDQKINFTGCQIDMESVESCKKIIEQATTAGNIEAQQLTNGAVQTIGQNAKIQATLAVWGVHMKDMTKGTIDKVWAEWDETYPDAPAAAKRLLELRATLGSASVKKLYTMAIKTNKDGRMREMFSYCGADRTGRFSGRGAQPQNLPNSGPKVLRCDPTNGCGHHYGKHLEGCPWCQTPAFASELVDWNVGAVDDALAVINHNSDLAYVAAIWGNPVAVVSACLRGLFMAGPGNEFISSDYSAIEAVVIACLAGEQWRIDVFNGDGKIYEASASQFSGVPLEEIKQHKKDTGDHHPLRKRGKVRELAFAYQGGIGAAKNFGADKFMTDDEIKADVKAWRAESPMIVKFWYGLEDAAINAIKYPGQYFSYRDITYGVKDDVLYCRLPSGRLLKYHQPTIGEGKFGGPMVMYWGRNSMTGQWVQLDTYGGKLAENVTQAVARDVMTHAMVKVDMAGYPIALHVHDELVCEVLKGWGSIEELERLMGALPDWCADWPISASGGWRGKRFRKD